MGSMSSLGRLAPRLRPLVAKPRGGDGGGSGRAWIPAAMHGALYVVLSASLVLSNKHLIVNTHTPILIASLGSLFGTIVAWTLVGVGHVKLKTRLTMHQWVTYILPIGACTAVSLAFANLALTYIRLSLAQMAKAFAPAVTAAALVSLKLDRTFDERCARAVCVIVFGCVVAAWGALDGQPHAWIGLGCMVACEIAEALRLCGVQYLLSSNTNTANTAVSSGAAGSGQNTAVSREAMTLFDGLFYFSPVTLVFLWLMVFVFEWDVVSAELHGAAALGNPGSLVAAGSFGFLANVAGLGVVQHGGALTLTVLSLLKNGAVILLAVALYADPVTVHSVGGYTVATYGFVMYQEARAKASAAAALSSQGNLGGFGDGVGDNNVNNVNNFESGVGLVGGTAVYLGGAVPMGSVGIDLGGMDRVVSGNGDGADVMSASSSARSLQVSFFLFSSSRRRLQVD